MPLLRPLSLLALGFLCITANAEETLRVAVLENSAPMSYRDAKGELTGFSLGIIRAVCEELKANCQFKTITLDRVVDGLVAGDFEFSSASLLDTPERRARILLSRPFFRSRSLWLAAPGVRQSTPGLRVAVVLGSAQEAYVRTRGWTVVPIKGNDQVGLALQGAQADAGIIPMPTAIALMQQPAFQKIGLVAQVLDEPSLGGDVCFGISPRRADLKERIDAALERIKRDGRYDKLNSLFLPFRVD